MLHEVYDHCSSINRDVYKHKTSVSPFYPIHLVERGTAAKLHEIVLNVCLEDRGISSYDKEIRARNLIAQLRNCTKIKRANQLVSRDAS